MLRPGEVVHLCLSQLRAATVLDVGTGTGLFAETFTGAGVRPFGVDVDHGLLTRAREHLPGCPLAAADATELPFGQGAFDLVFMAHVLHELEDPGAALREAARTSRLGVAVLEWPFREEETGPPLSERLHPGAISDLAGKAGLSELLRADVGRAVLYVFVRSGDPARRMPVGSG